MRCRTCIAVHVRVEYVWVFVFERMQLVHHLVVSFIRLSDLIVKMVILIQLVVEGRLMTLRVIRQLR